MLGRFEIREGASVAYLLSLGVADALKQVLEEPWDEPRL